jgi:hypothetical protein
MTVRYRRCRLCCCLQRSILEDPSSGFIVKDSLEIRYSCELFVTHGGAAGTARCNPYAAEVPQVPPSTRGRDMAEMLRTGRSLLHSVLRLVAACRCSLQLLVGVVNCAT